MTGIMIKKNEPCKAVGWSKAKVIVAMILTCGVLMPTCGGVSTQDTTKAKQHEVAKRVDTPHDLMTNETAGTPMSASVLGGSGISAEPPQGSPDGPLLTDPSHPPSAAGPIAQPSQLVTSALLTATPSSPTPGATKANSSYDWAYPKKNQTHGNTTFLQHPVLSGSMAIALPTPAPSSMAAQATPGMMAGNGSASLSSLASNTVLEVITGAAAMPAATTSTAYVYATPLPQPSGPNSSSLSADATSPSSASSSDAPNHLALPHLSSLVPGLAFSLLLALPSTL
ncbi:uncharacterized protein VP01_2312g2 [Puccinia sorghi]|uniref:Uncharacterized protein n=1 Tax=Puccinia sorghi TaxID=27349 RepID=A0A0L6V8E3_9BASI|nr:uncharacterized protein VP01_2312g2 [Puccinia sorghi]